MQASFQSGVGLRVKKFTSIESLCLLYLILITLFSYFVLSCRCFYISSCKSRVRCAAESSFLYQTSIKDIFSLLWKISPIIGSSFFFWSFFSVSLCLGRLFPTSPNNKNYQVAFRMRAPSWSFSSSLNFIVIRRQPEWSHSSQRGLQSSKK